MLNRFKIFFDKYVEQVQFTSICFTSELLGLECQFWSFDTITFSRVFSIQPVEKVGASAYYPEGEEGRERESLISHQFSSLEHVNMSMTSGTKGPKDDI